MIRAITLVLPLALLAVATAGAQERIPPTRQLGATTATSSEKFSALNSVRALPGNRVLVNDITGRRVVMLDETLQHVRVIADSTSATANAYSGRIGGLLPWRGDSSLFVDPQSLSMMVIHPDGTLGRVMSVPRSEDAIALVGAMGTPAVDPQGRIVYRAGFRPQVRRGMPAGGGGPGAGLPVPEMPDSAAILRVDLATRRLDTLAFVKVPALKMNVQSDGEGRVSMSSITNPLPLVDEWGVLPNGTLAIVRGRDYHVELIHPDGRKESAAKMPFEWRRLSDEDKVAFLDSVKAIRARSTATVMDGPGARVAFGGSPMGGGAPQIAIRMGPPGEAGPPQRGQGAGATTQPAPPQISFVDPAELPDYVPPFSSNAVRVDAEGNLWVRIIPAKAYPGGPIYDVVSPTGVLIDRVQIPADRTILGFGPDGAVYLAWRDPAVTDFRTPATVIERASVR